MKGWGRGKEPAKRAVSLSSFTLSCFNPVSLQINYNPRYIFHANVLSVDYFQIALCCLCRWHMSPPWLRGPLLINNQLNKGPGIEMSLSGSLRKLQISTCFKLAQKLLIVPPVRCYVLLRVQFWIVKIRAKRNAFTCKQDLMLNNSILACLYSEYLCVCVSVFLMCMHLANFPQLERIAVLLFCLSLLYEIKIY